MTMKHYFYHSSGVAGYFPRSDNVYEFRDNLFNKVDMVTETTRWSLKHPEIPERCGSVRPIEKFDPGFFGMIIANNFKSIIKPLRVGLFVLYRKLLTEEKTLFFCRPLAHMTYRLPSY